MKIYSTISSDEEDDRENVKDNDFGRDDEDDEGVENDGKTEEPIYAVVDLKNKYERRKLRKSLEDTRKEQAIQLHSSDYEEVRWVCFKLMSLYFFHNFFLYPFVPVLCSSFIMLINYFRFSLFFFRPVCRILFLASNLSRLRLQEVGRDLLRGSVSFQITSSFSSFK